MRSFDFPSAVLHARFTHYPPSLREVFWVSLGADRWRYFIVLFLFAGGCTAGALFPYAIGYFVDSLLALDPQDLSSLPMIILIFLLPFITRAILWRGAALYYDIVCRPYWKNRLLAHAYHHLMGHSLEYMRGYEGGYLCEQARAIENNLLGNGGLFDSIFPRLLLPAAIGFMVSIWTLSAFPWPFLLAYVLWALLALGLGCATMKANKRLAVVRNEINARVVGTMIDSFSNILAVKAQGGDHVATTVYDRQLAHFGAATQKLYWVWNILHTTQELAFLLLTTSFVALTAWQWSLGHLTPGQVAMLIPLVLASVDNIWNLVDQLPSIITSFASARNAIETVYQPHGVVDRPGARALRRGPARVEFKGVCFQYQPHSRQIFADLNFVIPAGQKVGIVGHSGAGKTTLITLLQRFYDIQQGQIKVMGQDISQVTQTSLRQQMALIPQETLLFHQSVLDNIRYARPSATLAEVQQAAQQAAAHAFIMALPQGYDTIVGERGVKLSGGQRQRIAIARALLSAAPILILDEATAALDTESERLIQANLSHAMRDRTVLAIAHRLSTLRQMDRILVLYEGQIVEDGPPQTLLKRKNSHFARLWRLQKDGFLPEA